MEILTERLHCDSGRLSPPGSRAATDREASAVFLGLDDPRRAASRLCYGAAVGRGVGVGAGVAPLSSRRQMPRLSSTMLIRVGSLG